MYIPKILRKLYIVTLCILAALMIKYCILFAGITLWSNDLHMMIRNLFVSTIPYIIDINGICLVSQASEFRYAQRQLNNSW